MRIADILGEKGMEVHTALPWITVLDAIRRLADAEVGALIVCDADRRIRGVISERDIVRCLAKRGPASLHSSPWKPRTPIAARDTPIPLS